MTLLITYIVCAENFGPEFHKIDVFVNTCLKTTLKVEDSAETDSLNRPQLRDGIGELDDKRWNESYLPMLDTYKDIPRDRFYETPVGPKNVSDNV
jgi:hypothetical protein